MTKYRKDDVTLWSTSLVLMCIYIKMAGAYLAERAPMLKPMYPSWGRESSPNSLRSWGRRYLSVSPVIASSPSEGTKSESLLLTSKANQGKRDDAAPSKEKQPDTSLSIIWLDYLERALANYQHPSAVKSTQTISLQLFFLSVYSFHLWHTNNMKLEHSAAPMLDFRGETNIKRERGSSKDTLRYI